LPDAAIECVPHLSYENAIALFEAGSSLEQSCAAQGDYKETVTDRVAARCAIADSHN
jgi:hypothetical protein